MKLSVVVPTLDEAPRLAAFLAPLTALRAAGHELIVVDGGSRDATLEIAAAHADRVLRAPRGRAAQMNTGATLATGDVLLFLHADCRLPERVAEVVAGSRDSGARWGRFDVALEGRSRMLPLVAALMNGRSRLTGISTGDQALFVQRTLFDAVGGFPPLALMEDVAMSRALKAVAGPPACLRERVIASGRRWDDEGAWRTIARMWALRFAYWRGEDTRELARRYYGVEPGRAPSLKVFAKAPLPGQVKTRLAAKIGDDAAVEVYRSLLLRTLSTAAAARRAGVVNDLELWFAPEQELGALTQWAEQFGALLHAQQGTDLGERMRHALRTSLDAGRSGLVIGTDVPGYDVAYLADAASILQSHDAVLGPADDGGYVLVGLARDVDVFDGIPWSTSAVTAATRTRLEAVKASWQELPPLWDIDTVEDYSRWRQMPGGAPLAAPSVCS